MKIITGSIFKTTNQTIVNSVNCFGIMGAGIALECRYRYPDMFIRYSELCEKKLINIGTLYLYKTSQRWVLNFPTKFHWKYDTKPEFIEKGLEKFLETYKEKGIKSIAFPLLGASNGGLSQEQSLALLEKHLSKIDIPVEIYKYDSKSPDDLFEGFKKGFLTTTNTTLKRLTDLKEDKIIKVKQVLQNDELVNMAQLMEFDGIGETTIEKCFNYASSNHQLNLL